MQDIRPATEPEPSIHAGVRAAQPKKEGIDKFGRGVVERLTDVTVTSPMVPHALRVVRNVSDHSALMHAGRIDQMGAPVALFDIGHWTLDIGHWTSGNPQTAELQQFPPALHCRRSIDDR